MKKQFLYVLSLVVLSSFIFANPVKADTEVSGNMTTDTTWTLANSPYIVTATVQVLQGAKLTIEPGVVVKFNKNAGLNIDGELIANGTINAMILFTSNQSNPHGGDWLGIQFTDNANGALLNSNGDYLNGSIIRYSTIEYGGTGTRGGVRVDPTGFSLFLSDSIIRNNNEIGITLSGSSGKIANNTISNHSAYGIILSAYSKNNIVSNNIINGNLQYGFSLQSSGNTISNNTITRSQKGLILDGAYNNTLSNNTINNNSLVGIELLNSHNNTISGNSMNGNTFNGVYIGGSRDKSSENNILDNSIENNREGIYFYFTQNIRNNYIKNNNIGIIGSNLGNSTISHNNIFDNTNYNFKYNTGGSSEVVNAIYNYWGSADKSTISAKIYDYYDDTSLGKVNYEPYGLAELKFDGTDTFSQPSTCVSWAYSGWSLCSNENQQTRFIISSFPSGCAGGNPVLTQSCTYIPPVCTSWTYFDWSTCQSNSTKTRTIISSSPSGCSGGNPILTQSCTYTSPICTSWIYSNWEVCANNQQTRTITLSQPANCGGGNPILSQSCNSTPLCTENNWTSTLTPTNCPNNGQQTKKWTKVGECQGGISRPPEETVSCDYQVPTCTNFTYSDWGMCGSSGVQSRTMLSASPSGCAGGSPVLNKSCNYIAPCTSDVWSCADWSNCSVSGSQARICTKTFDCPDIQTESPITNQHCEISNQNSQNEPQSNQIQNEPTLIKNNKQEVSQEKNITDSQVAEQRRSEVASAVQEILQVAERDSGAGQQVKIIVQTQAQNQEKLETSLQKVQNRSGFVKFFVGPNYEEINNAKKLLEQNHEQIKQLNQVRNQLVNQDDQQKLTEQIQLFEQSNQEIEDSLNASQKGFSLFGWLFRLFTK